MNMNICLRIAKFPLKMKFLGCELLNYDHFLCKNNVSHSFSIFSTASTECTCIRKYEFNLNKVVNTSYLSVFCGAQTCGGNSSNAKKSEKIKPKNLVTSPPQRCSNTNFFEFSRYKNALQKRFPEAFKAYRTFFNGMQYFYKDMKWYIKIWSSVRKSPGHLNTLNLKELHLYMQMPKDIIKLIPTMIGAWIPLIGYAVCALVLLYPNYFLTTHFWTPQQRWEFLNVDLRKRHMKNDLIIHSLLEQLKAVKEPLQYYKLANILTAMRFGCFSPTDDELMKIKDLFGKPPFNLQSLRNDHLKMLTIMHGLPFTFFKRLKLRNHAYLIKHMDYAIAREGGGENLSLETLMTACAIRGLHPFNINKEILVHWLNKWISITLAVEERHLSFLLHLPLFQAYKYPKKAKKFYASSFPSQTNEFENKKIQ